MSTDEFEAPSLPSRIRKRKAREQEQVAPKSPPPPKAFLSLNSNRKRKSDEVSGQSGTDSEGSTTHTPRTKRLKIRDSPLHRRLPDEYCGSSDDGIDDEYIAPEWETDCTVKENGEFTLEIIKSGVLLDSIILNEKPHWIIGRGSLNNSHTPRHSGFTVDIPTQHPMCSRLHSVIQHQKKGQWLIYDSGSVHFTFLNNVKIFPHKYYPLRHGDVLKFAQSTRYYVFNASKEYLALHAGDESELSKDSSSNSNVPINVTSPVCRLNSDNDSDDPYVSGFHEKRPLSMTPPPSPLDLRRSSPSLISNKNSGTLSNNAIFRNEAVKFPFDTKRASTCIRTEEQWIQLQTMLNTKQKLQRKIQERSALMKDTVTLSDQQLKDIDEISTKLYTIEDTIEELTQEIRDILRSEQQKELELSVESGEGIEGYFDTDESMNDSFIDEDLILKRTKKRPKQSSSKSDTNDESESMGSVSDSSGLSSEISEQLLNVRRELEQRRKSAVGSPRMGGMSDYDVYNQKLEDLQLKRSELMQGIRDIQRRLKKKECSKLRSECAEMSKELTLVRTEERHTLAIVERLRPAYLSLMDREPERVHGNVTAKELKRAKQKMNESSSDPRSSAVMAGSVGVLARSLKERKKEETIKPASEPVQSAPKEGDPAPVTESDPTSSVSEEPSSSKPQTLAQQVLAELSKRTNMKYTS